MCRLLWNRPHLSRNLKKARFAIHEMMAGGCRRFRLLVTGKASHAATSKWNQCTNGLCRNLQKSLEQRKKTFDNNTFHLLHFGTFHSGSAFIIICRPAHVRGSIGYYDPKYLVKLWYHKPKHKQIHRKIQSTSQLQSESSLSTRIQ